MLLQIQKKTYKLLVILCIKQHTISIFLINNIFNINNTKVSFTNYFAICYICTYQRYSSTSKHFISTVLLFFINCVGQYRNLDIMLIHPYVKLTQRFKTWAIFMDTQLSLSLLVNTVRSSSLELYSLAKI